MPNYSLNWTKRSSPVLYSVINVAHPPEARGLSALSLPLIMRYCLAFLPDGPAKKPGHKAKLLALADIYH